jgi:hypothetical protein
VDAWVTAADAWVTADYAWVTVVLAKSVAKLLVLLKRMLGGTVQYVAFRNPLHKMRSLRDISSTHIKTQRKIFIFCIFFLVIAILFF